MAAGIVMALFGLWVVLRTISSGSPGGPGNLTDWLLGLGGNSSSSATPTGTPTGNNPTAPAGSNPRQRGNPASLQGNPGGQVNPGGQLGRNPRTLQGNPGGSANTGGYLP
jgi:hypothetical protein